MALHQTPATMLKESLLETLEAGKICSYYRKTNNKWGVYKTGGCLGYPAAILLFSIVVSIGSYFRKDENMKILIDSKNVTIDSDGWQHFKILNSKYFNQNLSHEFILALYIKFRCFLTHNSILGNNTIMIMDNASLNNEITGKAFFIGSNEKGETVYMVSIKEFWELCKSAIDLFFEDIDEVVPKSRQGKNFN